MDVEMVVEEPRRAPGTEPARLLGARGRAECDAYAATVTERERARSAFCA